MRKPFTATIYFANDPSVGMRSEYFTLELPVEKFEDSELREEARQQIKTLYDCINDDSFVTWVCFADEMQEPQEKFPRWESNDILHLHYAVVNLATGNTQWKHGKFTPQRQNAIIHSIANSKNVNAEALNEV